MALGGVARRGKDAKVRIGEVGRGKVYQSAGKQGEGEMRLALFRLWERGFGAVAERLSQSAAFRRALSDPRITTVSARIPAGF